MKRQAYNPYLPAWEYIPDGEPRVFGDRLYILGVMTGLVPKGIVKTTMWHGLHQWRICQIGDMKE